MADPLVTKLADKVLDYLAAMPDGHETNPTHALTQLAGDEPDLKASHDKRTFTYKGVTLTHDETVFHLPVALHERARLHGIELERLEGHPLTEMPHVLPFAVRHLAV